MLLRHAACRSGRSAVCVLVLAGTLWPWPSPANAQPAVGAVAREGWLARAAPVGEAPTADVGVKGPRWFTGAAQSAIGTATDEGGAMPTGAVAPAYHDYFRALGYSFTHGIAAREQVTPLAIGTAAALALLPVDRKISDSVRGEPTALCRAGELVGHPITLGALSGSLVLGSLATDDERFRGYAFTLSQGLIVADSVTAALKLAVRRTRPDGTSERSFPSGHAAGSFALAAVSSHYYGAKAGVPLYALAALVALSRIGYGKHFPSDVVVGAAVGYISARAAIRGANHVTPLPNGSGSPQGPIGGIVPPLVPGAGGVSFYLRF